MRRVFGQGRFIMTDGVPCLISKSKVKESVTRLRAFNTQVIFVRRTTCHKRLSEANWPRNRATVLSDTLDRNCKPNGRVCHAQTCRKRPLTAETLYVLPARRPTRPRFIPE